MDGDVVQPNCSTVCTCQQGRFTCVPQRCMVDGPTCHTVGDPHYNTFDSLRYSFQGDGEYILAQPINSTEFTIIGLNEAINQFVSVTFAVRIIVPSEGANIFLARGGFGGTITINSVLQPNNGDGLVYSSTNIEVLRVGGRPYVLLTVGYPVAVVWDGVQQVRITVSTEWLGLLSGLCGNYNNDPNDDFFLPDGSPTTLVNDFGNGWLFANSTNSRGVAEPTPACPANLLVAAESRCSELMNGAFSVCNSIVDPSTFFDECVLDYCFCDDADREDCYCNSLAIYAATCASNGIIVPNWREFLCRKYFESEYPLSLIFIFLLSYQLYTRHGLSTVW